MDPAIDGHKNTVSYEESHSAPLSPATNPNGNFYEIRKTVLTHSTGVDANPTDHRVFKISNPSKKNPKSGNNVAYKFSPLPTQKILAHPDSIQAQRALFTQHHVWVTKYHDDELYAAGRFTLQSQKEEGGVFDMAARKEEVEGEDLVVWNVFGLTHNPRYVSSCTHIRTFSFLCFIFDVIADMMECAESKTGPSCPWKSTRSTSNPVISSTGIRPLMCPTPRTTHLFSLRVRAETVALVRESFRNRGRYKKEGHGVLRQRFRVSL